MNYEEEFMGEVFWEESDLEQWFLANYKRLGFEKIKPSELGYADFTGIKNGKNVTIELEGVLHCIASHPQWVLDKIDIIICYGGNYNGQKDISNKEIIKLVDHPTFFFEAISPRIKYIRKLQQYRKDIQKKFSEDNREI